jgi:hypothetical protein
VAGVLLRMPYMVAVEGARPMLACIFVEFLVTGRLESHPQCNLNVLIQLRTLNCPLEKTLGYSLAPAQRHTCSEKSSESSGDNAKGTRERELVLISIVKSP